MHPFFRSGLGNGNSSCHGSQFRKDTPRCKSPSGSSEEPEEEDGEVASCRRASGTRTSPKRKQPTEQPPAIVVPPKKKETCVPVIKLDDQVIFTGNNMPKSPRRSNNENKTRLGPNKNNIILEQLQNDLKGAK